MPQDIIEEEKEEQEMADKMKVVFKEHYNTL
jgi:hypothetical protein